MISASIFSGKGMLYPRGSANFENFGNSYHILNRSLYFYLFAYSIRCATACAFGAELLAFLPAAAA